MQSKRKDERIKQLERELEVERIRAGELEMQVQQLRAIDAEPWQYPYPLRIDGGG